MGLGSHEMGLEAFPMPVSNAALSDGKRFFWWAEEAAGGLNSGLENSPLGNHN